eukprot:4657795-Heterocapsa_arctica.AAC.1
MLFWSHRKRKGPTASGPLIVHRLAEPTWGSLTPSSTVPRGRGPLRELDEFQEVSILRPLSGPLWKRPSGDCCEGGRSSESLSGLAGFT